MSALEYFCAVWDFACIFLGGFMLSLVPISETRSASYLRAPNSREKVPKYLCLSLACFLCLGVTPLFGCKLCCGKYFFSFSSSYADMPAIDVPSWVFIRDLATFMLGLSGILAGGLFEWFRARRKVLRFIRDCAADGSLRAVYEEKFGFLGGSKWVMHDMRKGGHKLRRLAGRAIIGIKDSEEVYLAFNLPAKKLFALLIKYNFLTAEDIANKNYVFCPPSEFNYRGMLSQGGSILRFCIYAESVHVWG